MGDAAKKPDDGAVAQALLALSAAMIAEARAAAKAEVLLLLAQAKGAENAQQEKPLNIAEAAAILGISADAVRKHVSRGNILPVHHGNRGGGMRGHRFSRADIAAFVSRGKKSGNRGNKKT